MSSLRWIDRDGVRVLQSGFSIKRVNGDVDVTWSDVPTHQEPKKVTVADELTAHFDSKGALLTPYGYAVSAIEFMSNRMTFDRGVGEVGSPPYLTVYNQALKDVRKALFGEA